VKSKLRAALPPEGRSARLAAALTLGLGLFAYRALALDAFRAPLRGDIETWFFAAGEDTALLVIAIAAWLLWRRRERLRSLPVCSDRALPLALLVLAAGLFVWSYLVRASDLLLPSLAASLLAFAGAARGRRGCRAVLLPALVLLLGIRIPAPIDNELLWGLQRWTANGAFWLMTSVGLDVEMLGETLLRRDGVRFLVIESCSGMRGIQILTLVAVVIRELFAASGPRQWLLVLVAPFLGFALNVLRIVVVIVSTGDPEALTGEGMDHTPQGVAVLVSGTAILYALGWLLAGRESDQAPIEASGEERTDLVQTAPRWQPAALCFFALGLLSLAVQPFPAANAEPPSSFEIPERHAGWTSSGLPLDRRFVGYVPAGQINRHYEKKRSGDRPPQTVKLFVGFDVAGNRATSRLFSSKIDMPGSGWTIEQNDRARLWLLAKDADVAVAVRESDPKHALVYSWRVRDEGPWREAFRSLFALESGPFERKPPRVVVRLVTPLPHAGPAAIAKGKETLNQFISDFQKAFTEL
jgi:exosortase